MDLTRPIDIGRTFDLVLCLEVGEHLPEESADTLVSTTCVRHGGDILFSAAVPAKKASATSTANRTNTGTPSSRPRLSRCASAVRPHDAASTPVSRLVPRDNICSSVLWSRRDLRRYSMTSAKATTAWTSSKHCARRTLVPLHPVRHPPPRLNRVLEQRPRLVRTRRPRLGTPDTLRGGTLVVRAGVGRR